MKLEEKLVSMRKAKGLSQLKLAEMMGVSRQAVSRWEVGAAVPSTENLRCLGNLYGVPLEYLLCDEASEPVRSGVAETGKQANGAGDNRVLVVILINVCIVFIILLCMVLFKQTSNEPVRMDDIIGREAETDSQYDFEIEW